MSHDYIIATYIDSPIDDYVKQTIHFLLLDYFRKTIQAFRQDPEYNSFIYLCGYDDFIFPNALIPVNKPLLSINTTPIPDEINQIYYYVSQLAHDTCIVTHSLDFSIGSSGTDIRHVQYFGYKGILPTIDIEPRQQSRKVVYNKGLPNRDKFLVFPPSDNPLRVMYKFTPTPESNVYDVPDIGKVIMNPPANDEPWYGSQVIVLFDYGFIPPPIQEIDDSTGISALAFENVGTYLDDCE